jgi:hypothetical protein
MPRKRIKVKKGFPRRKNKELPTKHKPRKAEKSKLLEQGFQIYHQESDSDRRFRSICQLGHSPDSLKLSQLRWSRNV